MSTPDHDLLVVGAGIHGAGVAQAAAAAGHRVLLVERTAIAAGTSRASSKLIHGGLRYLETAQFGMVRESLRERERLLRNAPQLVRLVRFLLPVYRDMKRPPWQIRAGLTLYSALLGFHRHARFRRWSRAELAELEGLRQEGLRCLFEYADAQTDDAALTRAVVASAQELGAGLCVPAELREARFRDGCWHAVLAEGRPQARERRCTARVLVNAAGPWVQEVARRLHPAPDLPAMDLVVGTHVEVAGTTAPGPYYLEAPMDQRGVFVMPWREHTLVGTTERIHQGPADEVAPTAGEEQYLEHVFRHYFPAREWRPLCSWAGARTLPRGEGSVFRRPREVILSTDPTVGPHCLTILGGKLTTYRSAADKVLSRLAPLLPAAERRADTRTLRLPEPGPEQDRDQGPSAGSAST